MMTLVDYNIGWWNGRWVNPDCQSGRNFRRFRLPDIFPPICIQIPIQTPCQWRAWSKFPIDSFLIYATQGVCESGFNKFLFE